MDQRPLFLTKGSIKFYFILKETSLQVQRKHIVLLLPHWQRYPIIIFLITFPISVLPVFSKYSIA